MGRGKIPTKSNKIIPLVAMVPGLLGKFIFDAVTGITKSDNLDKLIWGIDPGATYNFDTALEAIVPCDQNIFYDNSLGAIGKTKYVEFKLRLKNGNHTLEKYHILGDVDDYELTTEPTKILGTSELLKTAN
tara:strand:+ start:569 stop:961 length:393 start_codon:yes stop_codon:yes gene_type:complete